MLPIFIKSEPRSPSPATPLRELTPDLGAALRVRSVTSAAEIVQMIESDLKDKNVASAIKEMINQNSNRQAHHNNFVKEIKKFKCLPSKSPKKTDQYYRRKTAALSASFLAGGPSLYFQHLAATYNGPQAFKMSYEQALLTPNLQNLSQLELACHQSPRLAPAYAFIKFLSSNCCAVSLSALKSNHFFEHVVLPMMLVQASHGTDSSKMAFDVARTLIGDSIEQDTALIAAQSDYDRIASDSTAITHFPSLQRLFADSLPAQEPSQAIVGAMPATTVLACEAPVLGLGLQVQASLSPTAPAPNKGKRKQRDEDLQQVSTSEVMPACHLPSLQPSQHRRARIEDEMLLPVQQTDLWDIPLLNELFPPDEELQQVVHQERQSPIVPFGNFLQNIVQSDSNTASTSQFLRTPETPFNTTFFSQMPPVPNIETQQVGPFTLLPAAPAPNPAKTFTIELGVLKFTASLAQIHWLTGGAIPPGTEHHLELLRINTLDALVSRQQLAAMGTEASMSPQPPLQMDHSFF